MKNTSSITSYVLLVLLTFSGSCTSKNNKSVFFTIDVNSAKEQSISLSKITEKIEAIELEMTENSLIAARSIRRVLYTGEHIIVCEISKVMLFDNSGKFIRQIGSRGQGPGEFTSIFDITADIINNHIYIITASDNRIICYDFAGKFIKENNLTKGGVRYINYINNNLLYLVRVNETVNREGILRTFLLTVDNNLLESDSLEVNKTFTHVGHISFFTTGKNDYISYDGENTFLYSGNELSETILDTLYQIKNKQLLPYLKLKFDEEDYKNRTLVEDMQNRNKLPSEIDRILKLENIYKSSGYVFSIFSQRNISYSFYYDIKTGESYKAKDGYTDDIHTNEIVKIRPFDFDANMFYYMHTRIDDTMKDEPNPTLYIGTLKK